jgi:hypothetical protein
VCKRLFGLIHCTSNAALYRLSHTRHHLYTLHRQSDGEVVQPAPELIGEVIHRAFEIVDIGGFVTTVYDQIYFLFTPFLKNPRRNTWLRYVYSEANPREQRDVYWTHASQFLFHLLFAVFAIAIGEWFLIVVVSLPAFYGGRW